MHQTLQLEAIGPGPHEVIVEHRGWRAGVTLRFTDRSLEVRDMDGSIFADALLVPFRPIPDDEYDGTEATKSGADGRTAVQAAGGPS